MTSLRTALGSGLLATALAFGSVTPAIAAPLSGESTVTVSFPTMDPWLDGHLGGVEADALVEVIVHGTDFPSASQAALDAGLLDTHPLWDEFAHIDAAVAIGTASQIRSLLGVEGLTYLEGNQPLEWKTNTSHEATNQVAADEAYADTAGLPEGLNGNGVGIAIIDSGVDWTSPMFNDVNQTPTDPTDDINKVVRRLKVNPACGVVYPTDPATQNTACVYEAPQGTDIMSVGGHGTHVAGIAGGYAVKDPLGGDRVLRGAAPGAQITEIGTGAVILVLGSAVAMNWVWVNHANPCAGRPVNYSDIEGCAPIKVTNHSYGPQGGGAYNAASAEAKLNKLLVEAGVTTVWAAGNDGSGSATSVTNPPAGDPNGGVIVVANYSDGDTGSRDGGLSSSSSTGKAGSQKTYPDLAAPGTRITSACNPVLAICRGLIVVENPYYGTISGTSMASPHIAGIAAVLIQAARDLHADGVTLNPLYDPNDDGILTPAAIEDLLEDTAEQKAGAAAELVAAGGDFLNATDADGVANTTSYNWGHGLVDVLAAMNVLSQDGSGSGGGGGGGGPVSCDPLVTDALDDTSNPITGLSHPDLDLASGRIVRNATNGTLTFQIAVPELRDGSSTGSNGDRFTFNFGVRGRTFELITERLVRETGLLNPVYLLRENGTTIQNGLAGKHDAVNGLVTFDLTAAHQITHLGGVVTSDVVMSGLGLAALAFEGLLGYVVDTATTTCTFPPAPTGLGVSIGDVAVSEAAGTATLTLTLDGAATGTESVTVSTADASATAGADYEAVVARTITFAKDATTATVAVTVLDDATDEGDETFTVNVTAGTGTTITDGAAVVTILDDDDTQQTPVVTVTPSTVEESGTATLDVVLTLAEAIATDINLTAVTVEEAGDATPGADYTPVDTMVTFPAGATTWTIQIPVLDDDIAESTEIVNLDLAMVTDGATFASGQTTHRAVNRITDANDQPVPDADVTVTSIDGNAPEGRTFVDANRGFAVDGTATVPQKKDEQGPNGDLVADAGNSSHVAVGSPVSVQGASFGGTSPYAFAWSFGGSAARFADAGKAGTTFDTTGLAVGKHQLTLTVTDGDGVVDTDTVAISVFAGGSGQLYDEVGTMSVSAFSFETDEHRFAVPAGASSMTIAVRWDDDGVSDLDLTATAPGGAETVSQEVSATEEVLVIQAPAAGDWLVEVQAFTSIPMDYTITVDAAGGVSAPDPTPVVTLPAAFDFAVGVPQVLTGSVAGGTDPILTWDINLDGAPDGTGTSITTNFPAGQHLVSLKATDAQGYEHRVVTAVRVGNVVGSGASVVVISVIDTGINLYHDDFAADTFTNQAILDLTNNFTKHPSEYLPGYPAATPALHLDLNAGYFPASDQATINNVQLGKLYWVPGTKVIAIRDDGSATGVDTVKMLDEDGHGTASASVAAGNIYGFCPSCLLAIGEGFNSTAAGIEENEDFYHRQKWVDITSNSFGPQANVGFGPFGGAPPQPKASAEGGQIAMYAAGNGAANAFIVPVQTYLPSSVGPDWIVRVGAAHAQRRQPILGDGNPVDISSFGAGTIPAAGIQGTNAPGSHSGTSSATPKSAGALGLVLGSARTSLGDTTNGWANGIVASGSPAGSGALADGVLTRKELLTAFFKTTEHDRNTSVFIPVQATLPYTPFQYLFEGYGLAEPASAARAIDVLMGTTPMPERLAEDEFFREFDEPVRDFLYGNYAESSDPDNGGESLVFGSSTSASTIELTDVLTNGTGEDLFNFWTANIGELPRLAASSHGFTNAGSVEVAVVTDGNEPQATDWVAADDTSTAGDFTTWSADLDGLAPGAYTVHARVVDLTGVVLATDGPFDVTVNRPFDPSCPVYNTRLGDDIAGDAILFDEQGLPSGLSNPALDVIAVDARTLTDGSVEWTLQVTDLDETYTGVGERYEVTFSAGTDAFALVAQRNLRDETGVFIVDPTFLIVKNEDAEEGLTGAFDATAETISWIVPPTVFDSANAADLAAASELRFTGAEGQRDNFTGYHAADGLASNGCAFYVGQDVRVPANATIEDVTVSEADSSVTLTINLDRVARDNETVLVSTVDGTATDGDDFTGLAGEVIAFANGTSQATVTVDLLVDDRFEGDQQFTVVLADGHDTTSTDSATVTVVDDDAAPTLTASAATVEEADGATLDVVLELAEPTIGDVEVLATTVDTGGADEATAGSDYIALDGVSFTIAEGSTTVTVPISVLDDDDIESFEIVNLDLAIVGSNATFAGGATTTRVVNGITDEGDQVRPTLTISGGTVDEPAVGGTAQLPFTVTLAGDVRNPVVVDLELAGGTADDADRSGLSSTQLTFTAPGTQVVTVDVVGDDLVEGDETVLVRIVDGSPSNADVVSNRTATGTIVDTTQTPTPGASIADVQVVEGSSGSTVAEFVIELDRPAETTARFAASTIAGSAEAGKDFTERLDALVLVNAGERFATFTVTVKADKKVEGDEQFTVEFTAVEGAYLLDGIATATILDDDQPEASIKGFSIKEDAAGAIGAVEVAVKLDQAPVTDVRVYVSTRDGGRRAAATAGLDYDAVGQWVTFSAGQTIATFLVTVHDDDVVEDTETFTMVLSDGEGIAIGSNATALVTIRDDD